MPSITDMPKPRSRSKDPVVRFEREYQEYHDISSDRRRDQIKNLRELAEHSEKPSPIECDADDIRSYLSALLERGDHPNTVKKKLNMLKPFYGWAWDAKLIDAELLMAVQRIKKPRGAREGLPRPYTRKEIKQFWVELDARWPEADELWWKRWRNGTSRYKRIADHAMRIQIEAMVALALHCGLRFQEIFKASIDDIHYDNAYVVVRHAKDDKNGDRFREVPHTEFSREKVRRWLELRTELDPPHDFPWLSLAKEQPEPGYLKPLRWRRYEDLLRSIGDWQMHRFRHTCGTEWLRAIKRIEIVSRLLGHARVQQTLGYAEIVRDDLHEAVANAEDAFMAALHEEETP